MTLKAKAAVLENGKKHKIGEVFETDEKTGLILIEYGWAEKVEKKKKKTK